MLEICENLNARVGSPGLTRESRDSWIKSYRYIPNVPGVSYTKQALIIPLKWDGNNWIGNELLHM